MRAAVFLEPGKLVLRDVPVPQPAAGELLVRVRAATTCGTDVKTYRRGHPKFPPPFVFGHEFGGDVVETGAGVRGFTPGMRVTANVFAECGTCFYCKHNQGNLCENLEYNFGAFAEYMTIPASIVRLNTFQIPAHISYAQAAIVEPLVCVVHGQRLIQIEPGERVALIGAGGPISLLQLQMVLRSGASQAIAVGHSDARLEVARQLGATTAINAKREDALGTIRDLTEGRGADVVIEAAGTPQAWQMAVEAVRKGGRVLWFGGLPGGTQVTLDATRLHYGEITLYNVHGGSALDAHRAFELICAGVVQTQPLISDEMPLERVEEALQRMIAGEVVKVAIRPDLPG